MFGIGPMELVVILVLALIIFGPGKLPEVGKAVGKAMSEFKRATRAVAEDDAPQAKSVEKAPPASGVAGASANTTGTDGPQGDARRA